MSCSGVKKTFKAWKKKMIGGRDRTDHPDGPSEAHADSRNISYREQVQRPRFFSSTLPLMFFVFQVFLTSFSLCPSSHLLALLLNHSCFVFFSFALFQIAHQLHRTSTNSVTMAPTDGNFLWSCPAIGGETSKHWAAGEGWCITERLHFHFQGCLVNAPDPASGRK